eukprot:6174667-Pleurochrysis_carterae.AAC.4
MKVGSPLAFSAIVLPISVSDVLLLEVKCKLCPCAQAATQCMASRQPCITRLQCLAIDMEAFERGSKKSWRGSTIRAKVLAYETTDKALKECEAQSEKERPSVSPTVCIVVRKIKSKRDQQQQQGHRVIMSAARIGIQEQILNIIPDL